MTREEQMLEQLIGDLLDHPPPGVAPSEMESWLRSHATDLIATVQKACADVSGHYYEIDGTWYVDDQFLRNLAARHEVLSVRADWEIQLFPGSLRCRSLRGRPALPGQVGLIYSCEPNDELEFPAQLHRWAQDHGLARFEGQWPKWPATTAPDPAACASCQARAAATTKGCGCTACKSAHSEDHA